MKTNFQKSRAAVAVEKLRRADINASIVLNEVQVRILSVYRNARQMREFQDAVLAVVGPGFQLVAQGKGHFGNPATYMYFRHDKDANQRRTA